MPPSIPPTIATLFDECSAPSAQVLVTSVLNATSHWFVIRLVYAAIYGIDHERSDSHKTAIETGGTDTKVVFVTIAHSLNLWTELGKKLVRRPGNADRTVMIDNAQGLNFRDLSAAQRLIFVDSLSNGNSFWSDASVEAVKLQSHSLRDLAASIVTANERLSQANASASRRVLILDGLDFILASQPEISYTTLTLFIMTLREQFSTVVVTAAADAPLLHNADTSATPLELEHTQFIRTLAYQSAYVVQMRPLETGQAKDVSGAIRFSRGGSFNEEESALADGEWLYSLGGNGSARVWGRGE